MPETLDVLRAIERAPMRTVRYQDVVSLSTNVWRVLADLVGHGAVMKLARGVYVAPPDGRDGRVWRPGLEAAGLALATARHGDRQAVLMGVGAARHWGAVPRAIGNTVIAVAAAGRASVRVDAGLVHFASRKLDRLKVVVEQTELGAALVTTPAQTLFDLLMRPQQGGEPAGAADAARAMMPQVSARDFRGVVDAAHRVNGSVRTAAAELGPVRLGAER